MSKAAGWIDYRARMDRVVAHVHEHFDKPLDLAQLAGIAHLSPCHWHRIYHALYGETLATTVRRLRLHHASGLLVNSSADIETVACRSGYPNAQSFARAFRLQYGTSPSQFRKHGKLGSILNARAEVVQCSYEVEIRSVPRVRVAGLTHRGSYMGIGKAFEMSLVSLSALGQVSTNSRWLAEYQDDPFAIPQAQLRSRAGLSVAEDWQVPRPLVAFELGGGRCAVLRHRGPYANMRAAYQWLFGHWLVQSGACAGDAPVFEEYLNNPRDTAPADLMTDVFLPLTD